LDGAEMSQSFVCVGTLGLPLIITVIVDRLTSTYLSVNFIEDSEKMDSAELSYKLRLYMN